MNFEEDEARVNLSSSDRNDSRGRPGRMTNKEVETGGGLWDDSPPPPKEEVRRHSRSEPMAGVIPKSRFEDDEVVEEIPKKGYDKLEDEDISIKAKQLEEKYRLADAEEKYQSFDTVHEEDIEDSVEIPSRGESKVYQHMDDHPFQEIEEEVEDLEPPPVEESKPTRSHSQPLHKHNKVTRSVVEEDKSRPTPKHQVKSKVRNYDEIQNLELGEGKFAPSYFNESKIIEPSNRKVNEGSVIMPNYSRKEIQEFLIKLDGIVEAAQLERKQRVSMGKGDDLIEVQPSDEDENSLFYLTEEEAKLLEYLRASEAMLDLGYDKSPLLMDGTTLTNLPRYIDGGNVTPIGIMSASEDKIKDPVSKIKRKLGLSISRNVPLWSSGFRLELEGPSTMDLLNLETKILLEKLSMSYDTNGFALTSVNIYLDRPLINFILENVTSSTSGTTDVRKLMRYIALTDLDTLVLALASTLFPDGYTMERMSIVDNDGELETKYHDSKFNPWRMLAVKTARLTKHEMSRVAKLSGLIDPKTIKEHRLNLRKDVNRFFKLPDDLYIKFHVPSLEEYLRIGMDWTVSLNQRVDNLLRDEISTEEQKNIMLQRATNIARIMHLAHWIEGFYIRAEGEAGEPEPIDGLVRLDPEEFTPEEVEKADESINSLIQEMTVDIELAESLLTAIGEFTEEMRVSSVVITREVGVEPMKGEHPHVIPLNPAEIFFTLLRHKILMAGG